MQLAMRTVLALIWAPTTLWAADPPIASVAQGTVASPHISMPASEESIKALLQITGTHKLVDDMQSRIDERAMAGLQSALAGRNLTKEQEAILLRQRATVSAVIKEQLNWDTIESMSIRVYRETLTQDELDGMLAFYKTPAGEAVIKKLPRITQEISFEMQRIVQLLIPKLMEITKASQEELKLATPGVDPCNPASAPCASPKVSPNPP